MGISEEYAIDCIINNKHNDISTTYMLLLKKHIKKNRPVNYRTYETDNNIQISS